MNQSEIELNSFAIRSFRDVADHDYIAARLAYRAQLVSQFLWLALQAIEKYTKCILLLNRINSKNVGHNLSKGLTLIDSNTPFSLRLSESSRDLIEHLDKFGRFRYLEIPFYVQGMELPKLDLCVWELRRYCRVLDYDLSGRNMLGPELRHIEDAENQPRQYFKLMGGQLEKIIKDHESPSRPGLIWQNLCFGEAPRKLVRPPNYMQSTNSPLSLQPEVLEEVLKYVFLPKEVIELYRKELVNGCS